jgi:hypothetical protein
LDLFGDILKLPTWQVALKKGDYVLNDVGDLCAYQQVVGMTRTPKRTRSVKGWSACCDYGEFGDTYIANFDCLIHPDVWEALNAAGWPEQPKLDHPLTMDFIDRDGVRMPIMVFAPYTATLEEPWFSFTLVLYDEFLTLTLPENAPRGRYALKASFNAPEAGVRLFLNERDLHASGNSIYMESEIYCGSGDKIVLKARAHAQVGCTVSEAKIKATFLEKEV